VELALVRRETKLAAGLGEVPDGVSCFWGSPLGGAAPQLLGRYGSMARPKNNRISQLMVGVNPSLFHLVLPRISALRTDYRSSCSQASPH